MRWFTFACYDPETKANTKKGIVCAQCLSQWDEAIVDDMILTDYPNPDPNANCTFCFRPCGRLGRKEGKTPRHTVPNPKWLDRTRGRK